MDALNAHQNKRNAISPHFPKNEHNLHFIVIEPQNADKILKLTWESIWGELSNRKVWMGSTKRRVAIDMSYGN